MQDAAADIETTAAEMKTIARTHALATQAKKGKRGKAARPVETATVPPTDWETPAKSKPRRGRPRGSHSAKPNGGIVGAVKREIRECERRIKALERALSALGAA